MVRIVVVLLFALCTLRAQASAGVEAHARALEKRLLAPCCWQGTLEVHHSELADALHTEIRARLRAGETTEAIQRSLVARFGTRVIAVPDPALLENTAAAVMAGLLAALLLLWARIRKGARPRFESEPVDLAAGHDEQLDEELRRMR